MQTKKNKAPNQRILVTLTFYLLMILISLIMGATHQIAGWVAQATVALALFRLVFLFGWGVAKNGWGWRA